MCLDAGINFFDTADVYGSGSSEKLIGQFLKETKAKIKIATKSGIHERGNLIGLPINIFKQDAHYLDLKWIILTSI